MNITIVIPLYKPDKKLLGKVLKKVKEQDFDGKTKIILIGNKGGLAEQLNWGIKKAKTEIVVTLQQDCVPVSKKWLKELIEPLKDKNIVASSSKVELPYSLWKNFDWVAKLLTAKDQGILFPILDEKGSAYRKSILLKVGLFNSENFKTAGEDSDMILKLEDIGKIALTDAKIVHFHPTDWRKRFQKELQYANGLGTLLRIHKFCRLDMFFGLIKSIPVIGWPVFLLRFPYKKVGKLGILWIPLSLILNFIYSVGFWRGFLSGKQKVYPDVNEYFRRYKSF